MTRRSWTKSDVPPEGEDIDVVDDFGDVWCYESGVAGRCLCGEHTCREFEGWWSPTIGEYDLVPFSRIFEDERVTRVTELTDEESRDLCGEMFS